MSNSIEIDPNDSDQIKTLKKFLNLTQDKELDQDEDLLAEVLDFLDQQELEDDDEYDYDEWVIMPECPTCKRNYNLVHAECGDYIDKCNCDLNVTDDLYYCYECDQTFNVDETDHMAMLAESKNKLFDDDNDGYHYYNSWDDDDDYWDPAYKDPAKSSGVVSTLAQGNSVVTVNGKEIKINGVSNTSTYKPKKKCSHKHDAIEIVDGFYVHCSSVNYKLDDEVQPDFGLYADYSWSPTWRNEFINWPDYRIPKDKDIALVQIADAFERILNGEMVEIGCIGGHGRTGTILACLYLLGQNGTATHKDAYKYVKENYCSSAIESDTQEWFIEYASHVWYGTEVSEEPEDYFGYGGYGSWGTTTTKKNYPISCSMQDHYAMILRGWKECAFNGSKCHHWNNDLRAFPGSQKTYEEGGSSVIYEKAIQEEQLQKFDYVYGGLKLDSDPSSSPCKPIDHYTMILNGHSECIRLGDECNWWDTDYYEYINHSTINKITLQDWAEVSDRVKFYLELYPKVEDYKKPVVIIESAEVVENE